MDNYNKIDWKKGLDITPEIFIKSDNYHIAERNLLGRFLAFQTYGILPNSLFRMEKSLDNDKVAIKNLECTAITKDGYLINIHRDTAYPKEIVLNATSDDFYLVLSVDPYASTEKQGASDYSFVLKNREEPIERGIPILKIGKNNSRWEIDNNYIPPAVALNSVDTLTRKYIAIKDVINEIIEKCPENNPLYLQITMLQLDLNNYSLQESPQEFIQLLKKFCHIFQLFLKNTKKIEELFPIKKFMEEPYNPIEIGNLFKLGFETMAAINQEIEEEIEEKDPLAELEIKI